MVHNMRYRQKHKKTAHKVNGCLPQINRKLITKSDYNFDYNALVLLGFKAAEIGLG